MNSAIYTGWVRHHRFHPRVHQFQYRVSMLFLELGEINTVFRNRMLWSRESMNVVSFRRGDHFGDPTEPLDHSIRVLVEEKTGTRPEGSICLLTNPRYFGFAMNPVSFYFCFQTDGSLHSVVAEINNTPWGEQHCYVLPIQDSHRRVHRFEFPKEFHVSPFMSMDQIYDWRIGEPGKQLVVHMKNREQSRVMMHATMSLKREALTDRSLLTNLIRFPFMTGKVFAAIYWNSFRLFMKKTPFFAHPKKKKSNMLGNSN
ncbi:MAG: DUF1365 domain-containing protein [Planctomycetota bacterium]|nr:DUF1365 domain-containing protein [Planctomycetota bacterium]